jgi:hypothetical protein
MLFPLHQEWRLSQNYQVDSSNGWVYFKIITLTIFPSRPQENLNIGSSNMPIFCLINPEIIACIVKLIVCVCNGASFVEGGGSKEDETQIPSIWPNYGHQWRNQKANALDNIWTVLELSTSFLLILQAPSSLWNRIYLPGHVFQYVKQKWKQHKRHW